METCIKINNVSKCYKRTSALRDINLSIEKNTIVGIIGGNGAGKTTLFRVISGVTKPDSGEVIFGGEDKKRVGALIEKSNLFSGMTGLDNMRYYGRMSGITDEEKLKELLDVMGLTKHENKKVYSYSTGMKQRLGIAVSLIGNPELLILDEPFNGLDEQGTNELEKLIFSLKEKQGLTIMISSHMTEELVRLCDSFIVMDAGSVIQVMEKQDIEKLQGSSRKIEEYIMKKLEGVTT
jgi:ABC-2 type transport system ATP-binding protein